MRYIAAIIASCLLFALGASGATNAAQSRVDATVCASGTFSAIDVIATVDEGQVIRISGTVEQAPYVDIFVDGQKKTRINIEGTQTQYFTTLTVDVGVHQIQAFIYDACTNTTLVGSATITIAAEAKTPTSSVPSHDENGTPYYTTLLNTPVTFRYDKDAGSNDLTTSPFLFWTDTLGYSFFGYGIYIVLTGLGLLLYGICAVALWKLYSRRHLRGVALRIYKKRARFITYVLVTAAVLIAVGLLIGW